MTDPTADAAKLLPCPFCGVSMKCGLHTAAHPSREEGSRCLLADAGECGGGYELIEDDYPSWNTRPQPAPMPVIHESGSIAPETWRGLAQEYGDTTQHAPPEGELVDEITKLIETQDELSDRKLAEKICDRLGLAARPKVEDAEVAALVEKCRRAQSVFSEFGEAADLLERLAASRHHWKCECNAAEAKLAEREAELVKARSDLRLLREYAGLPARIAKRQNASGDGLGRLWKLLDEWDMRDARLAGSEYETGHAARQQPKPAEPAAGEDETL